VADAGVFLADQRRQFILEKVRRDGAVRVVDLVESLAVSDMTIRRDLDFLARRGALEKVYGGAIALTGAVGHEPDFASKSSCRSVEKKSIAQAAAARVEPGSVVAISAGTTAFEVAARLLDVPRLTVVTNSLPVADLLRASAADRTSAVAPELILTGGSPTPSASLVGPIADLVITSLHVDVLIMGAFGVTEQAGLSTPNLAEAQTNRAFVSSASHIVVVADHGKWGVRGLSSFAALNEIDCFITDAKLPAAARTALAASVGKLLITD
jgi:DeoR/GlpR family transcriptional regulator of sugar metabolism